MVGGEQGERIQVRCAALGGCCGGRVSIGRRTVLPTNGERRQEHTLMSMMAERRSAAALVSVLKL